MDSGHRAKGVLVTDPAYHPALRKSPCVRRKHASFFGVGRARWTNPAKQRSDLIRNYQFHWNKIARSPESIENHCKGAELLRSFPQSAVSSIHI
jgi:hypothetical protein